MWRCRLGDEEAALRGRPEGRLPVGFVQLPERLRLEPLRRRVHEQVEPAQLRHRPVDEAACLLDLRHVAVPPPGCDYPPALALEPRRDRRAELARAAGYERSHPASDSTPQLSVPGGVCLTSYSTGVKPMRALIAITAAFVGALAAGAGAATQATTLSIAAN